MLPADSAVRVRATLPFMDGSLDGTGKGGDQAGGARRRTPTEHPTSEEETR
ncbi:hypothetical protein [Streptomyces umbrinus]|uniref:hypothetical protein n=1 Tax=Streptomyces umbrinus TaxID=67370 RepID=UPI001678A835|nr:hypothetical protein [Streptomyces umbrinus]GHB32094.1 hypothetical protein GCM10010306_026600 [Streptomyces umbrinus]